MKHDYPVRNIKMITANVIIRINQCFLHTRLIHFKVTSKSASKGVASTTSFAVRRCLVPQKSMEKVPLKKVFCGQFLFQFSVRWIPRKISFFGKLLFFRFYGKLVFLGPKKIGKRKH